MNEFMNTSCGSPNYAAPEVITGKLYAGPEVIARWRQSRDFDAWRCCVFSELCVCESTMYIKLTLFTLRVETQIDWLKG